MKELLNEIQASVMAEYERAKEKFGAANNSPHESASVIREEVEEALEELDAATGAFDNYWSGVKQNQPVDALNSKLRVLQGLLESAAAELVQAAAMCYKATIKLDTDWRKEN